MLDSIEELWESSSDVQLLFEEYLRQSGHEVCLLFFRQCRQFQKESQGKDAETRRAMALEVMTEFVEPNGQHYIAFPPHLVPGVFIFSTVSICSRVILCYFSFLLLHHFFILRTAVSGPVCRFSLRAIGALLLPPARSLEGLLGVA
jgi:hypothetical protein